MQTRLVVIDRQVNHAHTDMYRFHIDIPDDLWERFKTQLCCREGTGC